ncbi:hypothetical protein LB507_001375 [Fusarium sp. FIESC RH6]|nr:hypothetical protein LB507_001375 [Fusarium sp. FIESC RH6]
MPRLRPTIRQRAAIAAAMADAKGQDAKSQDTKMDSAEAHLRKQELPLEQVDTFLEAMQIQAQVEKYRQDIAENENMRTDTVNKVKILENDMEAVDQAIRDKYDCEDILIKEDFDQVEGRGEKMHREIDNLCKTDEFLFEAIEDLHETILLLTSRATDLSSGLADMQRCLEDLGPFMSAN